MPQCAILHKQIYWRILSSIWLYRRGERMTAEELFQSEMCGGTAGDAPVCPIMLREGYPSQINRCDCPKARVMLGFAECQMPAVMECSVRKALFG